MLDTTEDAAYDAGQKDRRYTYPGMLEKACWTLDRILHVRQVVRQDAR